MTVEFRRIRAVIIGVIVTVLCILFLWIVYPYLYALIWAVILAIMLHPLFHRLERQLHQRRLAAFLTILLFIIAILLPLSAILGIVVQQAIALYTNLSQPSTIAHLHREILEFASDPRLREIIGTVDIPTRIRSLSTTLTSHGYQWIKVGSQSTITAILQLFVMLYSLYYFLMEGDALLKRIMTLLPLGDTNERILYHRFASTARATLKGTIFIGVLQGLLGGFLFFLAGVPSAAFWGLIMFILSIIPAVGPALVWLPVVIYHILIHTTGIAILVLIGGILIQMIDHVIRPPLVGKDTQLHPLLILFSTIGGIGAFGISGVVLGPIVASLLMAFLAMYEQKFKRELAD